MARVSEVEVERLKREISLERRVQARGVELKRHGADFVGRCPFHEDRTPSLVVSPKKNLWHCLGACQTGGSVIDWVMKVEGVSFRHAVELLRADSLPTTESATKPVKVGTVRKLAAPVSVEAGDAELLKQVVGYYHERLKQSPEALGYLESRGLKSSEMVERFQLGFADRTLGLRLPMANREAGAAIRSRLQKLGIIRESGHEHFNGSVVFPILDERGEVLGLYGRKVTRSLRPGTPLHLYLPGPHRGVWNVSALPAAGGTVILCEAIIDALTFWCAGFRNVLASYGVEGFTEHHLAALKQHRIENVLVAYDRDDAGERAAEKLAERLCGEGLNCYRVEFPRGMDANGYAKQMKPAEKAMRLALSCARWMGKGRPRPNPLTERTPTESIKPTKAISAASPLSLAAHSEPVVEEKHEESKAPMVMISPSNAPMISIEPAVEKISVTNDRADPSIATPAKATELNAEVMNTEPAVPKIDPPNNAALPSSVAAPKAEVAAEQKEAYPEPGRGEETVFTLGDRRYRVRGLTKNTSFDVLRVNVLCSKGEAFHVDTVDLYSAKARAAYVKQAAEELRVSEEILKHDLGQVLLKLEELQERNLKAALEPKKKAVTLEEHERQAALELLTDPNLLERILRDFEKCGVVGEETNKLVGYLAATSRKLEEPLAVIIQSSSAAGKTSLMEAVLSLMPEEDRVKYSAMTGQSLFYMGDADLKHKVLAIVEEEGASRASYALKLLQSEGELTIASTGKDPQSGRLVTHEYRVEGPVQLFLTTTAIELDEELLNRCLVLTVDEDREQTRAIHRLQRERQTLEGLLARKDRDAILKLHRNAQRLLRPLAVVNPFARELTFLDDRTRTRRDHVKYLTLIRTLALLHQHQRPVKTVKYQGEDVQYVEVTREDLAAANRLAHQVLGRSLDELPPQTRRLLMLLDSLVTKKCEERKLQRKDFRFTRREVREATGWGNTQLKVHLHRLEELEYLAAHRSQHGQGFVYELLYDGQGKDGTPFLAGLIDAEKLAASQQYDEQRSAPNDERSGLGRPLVGPESGPGRSTSSSESSSEKTSSTVELRRNAHLGAKLNGSSYEHQPESAIAIALAASAP